MIGRKSLVPVLLLGVVAYYFSAIRSVREGKLIETKSGAVRGIISLSRDGREFYEWLGIPFAKPPVGKLRFASPEPVGKWRGIHDGRQYGSQCVQNNILFHNLMTEDEDCLFLNIAIPRQLQDEGKLLPVVVYIHGGAFIVGTSMNYRPDFFMDEDVVFVSIQYRVDILGFLSTGDKAIRGNMGLKDQVQALKWLQENIISFGGDPNKVTIFGHSAGGASVHHLLLSPMSKGLFSKAISQSGAASNTWGLKSPAKSIEKTKSIAQALDCPTSDSEELADCLRSKSTKELMDTVWMDLSESPLFKPYKFGDPTVPTIELVDDEEAFLTQHPLELVAQGKAHRVPWMVGHTTDEGLLSMMQLETDDNAVQALEKNLENSIKTIFAIDSSKNNSCDAVNKKAVIIRDFYLPPSQRLTREGKLKAYTRLFGDAFFSYDIRESIFYQRQFSPVYPYFYSKTDGPNVGNMFKIVLSERVVDLITNILYSFKLFINQSFFGIEHPQDDPVASHAGDMVYLFKVHPLIEIPKTGKHYEFSRSYVKLVVDFAKNETQELTFRGVNFPATPKQGPLKYLEIANDVPKIITEPFEERMKLLQDLNIRHISVQSKV